MLNWEDSEVKIKNAHDAVSRLRMHHREQEEVIQTEDERRAAQKRFREHQARVVQSQQSLQTLNDRLTKLAMQVGTQESGYAFQDWFYDLADFIDTHAFTVVVLKTIQAALVRRLPWKPPERLSPPPSQAGNSRWIRGHE